MADTATPAKPVAAPAAATPPVATPAVAAVARQEPVKASAPTPPAPAPVAAKAAAPQTVAAKPVAAKPVAAVVAKAKPAKPAKLKPAPNKASAKPVITRKIAAKAAPAKKEQTMDAIKNTTAKAESMMADATARTKTAVDKGQKMIGEMNDFSKGNIEAIVESSKIAAKGIEAMGQDAVAYAKKSFEEATAAAKQFASVKSPTEFMKLQSDYVRSSFDAMVAHGSKSTEAMLKLAGEVAQPISNRVSLAAEKVKIAA